MRHLLLPLLVLLSACSGEKAARGVEDGVVRLPAVAGNPGAAYFTLNGGTADETLVDVTSPDAVRTELHESSMDGGVMKMRRIEGGIKVAAGGSVHFAPGGKHVMLFDINPAVKAGGTMKLVFRYADAPEIEATAKVMRAGDAMAGHNH